MVGAKEICALLLAGGMGAGSVVAVQQAKSPVAKQRAAKPVKHKVSTPSQAAPSALRDCPSYATMLGGAAGPLAPLAVLEPNELGLLANPGPTPGVLPVDGAFILPPGGGGGGGLTYPPAPPIPVTPGGVPQPAAWAMMVTGFGLVGLSLRRTPAAEAA
jgi:hypothetical protein